MKTNILWNGKTVIGTITSKSMPDLSLLPSRLTSKWSASLSLAPVGEVFDPKKTFTDVDGGVYGVRYFSYAPATSGGFLVSPSSMFIWESVEGFAKDFNNQGALRGHIGFHAGWPESLELWQNTLVDHPSTGVKALVKGFGDMVLGEVGWRAERMVILSLLVDNEEKAESLQRRYVGLAISVGEEVRDFSACVFPTIEWTKDFQTWMENALAPKQRVRRSKMMLSEFEV